LSLLLWPISLVVACLLSLRRRLYSAGWLSSERVPAVVVVVGNVVTGGVGKTPLVMALVQHLQHRGVDVGVVSRGHGRRTTGCREVLAQSMGVDVGDEPKLIHQRTGVPVFVAASRSEAALALLKRHPAVKVIVCDDGLQHLAIQRDIEICVFDDRGIGNGRLLPAGPLREPWPRKVDLVVHTGARPTFDGYRATRSLAATAQNAHGESLPLTQLSEQPLHAVAAIAWPKRFFDMLRAQGLHLLRLTELPDHDDFENWQPGTPPEIPLICTEKDASKLWRRYPRAWAVALKCDLEPSFWSNFDHKLNAALSSRDDTLTQHERPTHGQQTS
jgi:tetraacyldisaccharide 4'-kinase